MMVKQQTIKQRKCKNCRKKFIPDRPFIVWCSPECGAELGKAKIARQKALRAKKARKEYCEAKERTKTRSQWLKEAQAVFNAWIRKRDEGLPCVSCGGFTGKKNAGHYRSIGSAPELRFNPFNVHLQCEKCNSYLSGNLINYRAELIRRIGITGVEKLEGPHPPKKYSIEDLKAIKAEYKHKFNELHKLQN